MGGEVVNVAGEMQASLSVQTLNTELCIPLGGGADLVEASFVARPNRFVVEALLAGELVRAHLHDRGRLKETLVPGARLVLARKSGAKRSTAFQAVAAYVGEGLASIDTVLPNRLVEVALRSQALPPFASYGIVRREATHGASRFDFLLLNDTGQQCYIEVKSAGLIIQGVSLFPDAPTSRGQRHLRELAQLAAKGIRVAVLFVVQGKAHEIRIDDQIDPGFGATLAEVAQQGVEIHAYSCPITLQGIALGRAIPVFASRTSVQSLSTR